MNKHFYLLLFLCISYLGFAQTKGINYQAVIIDPTRIDIPAYDISAHPYVNKEVWLKFGIYSGTRLVYEEVQKTNTDAYGLVNLLIGTGLNTGLGGSFASIVWDGTILSLGTKISFNHGNSYTEISKQAFTYVPYAQYADVASKLSVVLPVSGGGTGATNAIAARANLGFGNIDNTADVDKPVSTATLAQLNNKESLANKSSDINADANSTVKYPTVKAIKEYVDARVGSTGTGPVTATKLASSININGVPFDGSMDITVAAEAETLNGTVAILHGGTGATTATGALTNLRAESLDNKSTNIALDANSTAKYPSVKLIKDYVDTRVVSGGINDGSISSAKISDATIVDADVAANAAIAFPKLNIVKSDITGLGIQETLPSTTTTIGSTAMALGGTYSSITGLSSVTSTGFTGALIGNASTATALSTGRTISTTGDVIYTSGSFNGTSDVTGTATLTNTAVSPGNYGSSTAIPTFTVDNKGRLTSANTAVVIANSGSLSGTTLASNVLNSSLTGLGTITSGTWSASTVDVAHGGTGAVSLSGIVKGNGTGAFSPAVAGVDFESAIAASSQTPTASYWRGDKSWQNLTTDVVPELTTNLYFTKSRVLTTELSDLLAHHGTLSTTDNLSSGINKLFGNQLMNSSTGVFTFTGISLPTATTFNVGAAEGYIIDNTSDIEHPSTKYIEFPGASGLTTPYLGSHTMTYIYLDNTGTLQLSGTELTPAQRRQNILLGKLGHPDHTNLISSYTQPDVLQSPLSQLRDIWQPIRLVNDGFTATANGANLSINTTAGTLFGLGIGYGQNPNSPSSIAFAAKTPVTFQYRTQLGGVNTDVTTINPTIYDNLGTLTTVAGTGAHATNQRIFLLQNGKIRVQYGQTDYTSLVNAIAGIQTESFSTYAGIKDYGILIGILSLRKDATNLSDPAKAQFFSVSKFGETIGATSGVVTSDLQQSYNNGSQIITNSANGAFDIRRGSAADTDNLIVLQNGAGTPTFTITGAGTISSGTWSASTIDVAHGGTGLSSAGTNGQVLTSTGAGTLTWTTPSSSPAGPTFLTKTGNYTITSSDLSTNLVLASTSTTTVNFTLPLASSVSAGTTIYISRSNDVTSVYPFTVTKQSSDSFVGHQAYPSDPQLLHYRNNTRSSTQLLYVQLMSNGTSWFVLNAEPYY